MCESPQQRGYTLGSLRQHEASPRGYSQRSVRLFYPHTSSTFLPFFTSLLSWLTYFSVDGSHRQKWAYCMLHRLWRSNKAGNKSCFVTRPSLFVPAAAHSQVAEIDSLSKGLKYTIDKTQHSSARLDNSPELLFEACWSTDVSQERKCHFVLDKFSEK